MPYPPPPITDVAGRIAVVTGGGTGIGRELVRQLAAAGADVATCDLSAEHMSETLAIARDAAADGVRLTSFVADVADEPAMDAFAAHVAATFDTEHVELVFNNAGIGGGGSLINAPRAEWEHVFDVCWGGVLNGTRAFLPMLLASERGQVVNTSSVNGMWACLGVMGPHTAYSSAKFAVRGFTEALMVDFRVNAPHLTAAVVMPGHVGTRIFHNSVVHTGRDPEHLADEHLVEVRETITAQGIDVSGVSDDDIRSLFALRIASLEHDAPTSAADAATIILDGVRAGTWRILVGDDAHVLDELVRERPADAYTDQFGIELTARGGPGTPPAG